MLQQILCRVRACYVSDCNRTISPVRESEPLTTSIQVMLSTSYDKNLRQQMGITKFYRKTECGFLRICAPSTLYKRLLSMKSLIDIFKKTF